MVRQNLLSDAWVFRREQENIAAEAAVGGLGGEVRGGSQSEVWHKFEQYIRPQVVEQYGLFLEGPLNKEDACRSMRYDPLHGSWVLGFYFSK